MVLGTNKTLTRNASNLQNVSKAPKREKYKAYIIILELTGANNEHSAQHEQTLNTYKLKEWREPACVCWRWGLCVWVMGLEEVGKT